MKNILRLIRKKILSYLNIAGMITGFVIIYFYFNDVSARLILIYFLVLLSLYYASRVPGSVLVINSIGLLLLLGTMPLGRWPITLGLVTFLVATVIIPFYFSWFRRWGQENFRKWRKPRLKRIEQLHPIVEKLEADKEKLEKQIEGINRLYILGRELVEHMDIKDVVENLQRVLMSRPGVKSMAVFSRLKNDWEPLCFSQAQYTDKWLEYLKHHEPLFMGKRFRLLPAPNWLVDESVVFWPVRLEEDLLAGIILTTEPETALRYLEEGEIFIPQIALGLRRTRLFSEVQERSRVDGLTGLYLRRYFLQRFQIEIQRAKRYTSVFSVLMIDIDFFKKVNDTHGHPVGDEVLRSVAGRIIESTPPEALAGRYGGEEFIVLLPLTNPKDAIKIAEAVRERVSHKEFAIGDLSLKVTVSVGVSHYAADGVSVKDIVSAADQALYWVKTHGRNNVKEFAEGLF
jgi:diguanylate cyclase (GGDEF)-like protein